MKTRIKPTTSNKAKASGKDPKPTKAGVYKAMKTQNKMLTKKK